ncbi:hypothetical protein IKF88_01350 [Candidatus Saccharibacteria bacterium]|nr:hypothetical protein [Candidatus Saccharibacteria bacterium]
MDDKPEDWEKQKRIKAEVEKARHGDIAENKANLQYLDSKAFAVQKGTFSRDPEAYRASSEKISSICLVTIILGVILDAIATFVLANSHAGLADMVPSKIEEFIRLILVDIPALSAIFAAIEAIIYSVKTRKKLFTPLINVAITIIIFVACLRIRELILVSGLNV